MVTTNSYTTKYLSEILREVNVKGLTLPNDNASFHTARLPLEFLEQKCIKVVEHPSDSTNIAIACDF